MRGATDAQKEKTNQTSKAVRHLYLQNNDINFKINNFA